MNKILLRKLVVVLLYLLGSAIVLFIFVVRPGINGYSRAMFSDMVYGEAYKPFVSRTLLPSAVRAAAEITPQSLKESLTRVAEKRRIRMVDILGWETEYVFEYFVALVFMFGCFFGLAFALRYLIKLFYDYPSFVEELAPVGGLMILPVFFKYYSYIYDPCTLLLFTLAVGLMAAKRYSLFYLIFLLATFNKETSILLAALFFVHEFRVMHRSSLTRHVLLQVLIWIAVRGFIVFLFRNNEGSLFEFHLLRNLELIYSPRHLIYFILVIAVFVTLLKHKWAEKPVFLRNGLFVALVPLVLLALFFGWVDELRDYYEAYPFLFLLCLPAVVDIFQSSPTLSKEGEYDQAASR